MVENAAFDIETFCPIEKLPQEDYIYLRKRKGYSSEEDFHRELATNPYISFLISFSLFFLEENVAEVYYLCRESDELREDYWVGNRAIEVIYKPVSMESDMLVAERVLLELFWERIGIVKRLISFHGKNFDMEFMRIRTILHNLKPQNFFIHLHSEELNHVDLKDIFKVGKDNYSLSFISKRFGIPIDKGDMDGSKIRDVFLKGDFRRVAEYNLKDAIMTGMLYERVKDYLWEKYLMESLLKALELKGILKAEEFIEYAVKKGIFTLKEVSKLIDLYSNKVQIPTEKQINYLLSLAKQYNLEMETVCSLLSYTTRDRLLQSLNEEEVT